MGSKGTEYLPRVTLSLDDVAFEGVDGDEKTYGELVEDERALTEDALIARIDGERKAKAALDLMTPRERFCLLMHAQGYTLEAVGWRINVCRERVRQLEKDGRRVAKGLPRMHLTDEHRLSEQRRKERAKERDGEHVKELERARWARHRAKKAAEKDEAKEAQR